MGMETLLSSGQAGFWWTSISRGFRNKRTRTRTDSWGHVYVYGGEVEVQDQSRGKEELDSLVGNLEEHGPV